jgi:hypothetical protein
MPSHPLPWLVAILLLTGCGVRQAVYVPQGYQELAADGSYVQEYEGVIVHMPLLVVSKSDVTLHPAITIDPRTHQVRLVSALWHLGGKDFPPLAAPDRGRPIVAHETLDLHWDLGATGPAVAALGNSSWIQLEVLIDGKPHGIHIELARRDHF